MRFGFTQEQECFRKQVRDFLATQEFLMEEVARETDSGQGWGARTWEFLRQLGRRGWLTPSWPEKYGGIGGSHMQRFLLLEEVSYQGANPFAIGATMAGPVILRHGSEAQKKRYLPQIARGEIEFALGYTEPQAGSDLAGLQMEALDRGDHFLLSGRKVLNLASHYAAYHWLAVRTDASSQRKHDGISLLIVDSHTQGIHITDSPGMGGFRTSEVLYEKVRVPKDNLVGELHRGWYYIGEALNYERVWVVGPVRRRFDHIMNDVAQSHHAGMPTSTYRELRHDLAQLAIDIQVAYLLGARIAWMLDRGSVPAVEAAMAKIWGSELEHRVADLGVRAEGLFGQLSYGSPRAPRQGWMSSQYLQTARHTIVRGSSEIMRTMVATKGLGLPRG